MKEISNTHVNLGETTWPRVGIASEELEWRLRFAQRQVTETDLYLAASYIASYRALVNTSQNMRDCIVKELSKAEST